MTSTPVTLTNPASTYAVQSLLFDDLSVVTWVGGDGRRWPVAGGMAPLPPEEGVLLWGLKGLHGPFAHITQQGAHQDGVDWLDTTYDKAEVDMNVTFMGNSAAGRRRVFREWLSGWDPKRPGKLCWFTQQLGEWWLPLRLLQEPRDTLVSGDAAKVDMNWAAQADFPFWTSFDSISPKRVAAASTAQWFLPLSNFGDQDGWPRYLLQGPGIFVIGDNGGTRTITLPLTAGQTARITTLPMRRTVTEINTGVNLYPKLVGRFSTPVAPATASGPTTVQVPISVTGATAGVTSAIGSLTPWRRWPE